MSAALSFDLPPPLPGPGPIGLRRLGDHGPDLVLIHGIGRVAATWAPQAHLLQEGCRVLLADNPGFGLSRGLRAPLTVEAHARLHQRTLEALPPERPLFVVGLSLGGMIAMVLAALLGERCRGVAILASSARETGFFRLAPPALLRACGRLLLLRGRHAAMLPEIVSPECRRANPDLARRVTELQKREGTRRGSIARQLLAGFRFQLTPWLDRLPARRIVVVGTADRLVPPAHSRRLAEMLNAPLFEIPGRGHDLALDGGAPLARILRAELLD